MPDSYKIPKEVREFEPLLREALEFPEQQNNIITLGATSGELTFWVGMVPLPNGGTVNVALYGGKINPETLDWQISMTRVYLENKDRSLLLAVILPPELNLFELDLPALFAER